MSPIFWTCIFLFTILFIVLVCILLYYFDFSSTKTLVVSTSYHNKWMW